MYGHVLAVYWPGAGVGFELQARRAHAHEIPDLPDFTGRPGPIIRMETDSGGQRL